MKKASSDSRVRVVAAVLIAGCGAQALAQPPPGDGPRVTNDHAIDAYISEDAIQALYMRMIQTDALGPIEVRGGIFYNEQRDLIGIADGLIEVGEVRPAQRLVFSVGPRMYGAFLNQEDEDIFGIGVGGQARYFFNRSQTMSVTLSYYYAPDILTFGAADNVNDVALRLQAQLRDGTDVYVGYRELELDVRGGDREVDDNVHLGFRRNF